MFTKSSVYTFNIAIPIVQVLLDFFYFGGSLGEKSILICEFSPGIMDILEGVLCWVTWNISSKLSRLVENLGRDI